MALIADKNNNYTVVIRFGGGLNSQAAPEGVDPRECTAGQNFDLPPGSTYFKPRKAIQRWIDAPNALPIRGAGNLINSSGTITAWVQAGGTVYKWDGTSGTGGMTAIAAVNPASRLRGRLEANSVKDDYGIVTDLALLTPIMTWNGSTLARISTNLSTDFFAKYAVIAFERALYGNVKASTALPHVMVASQQSAYGTLTTSQKPASTLSASDTFYLPTPNNTPITGLIPAFGKVGIPTQSEEWFQLGGTDARDHKFTTLYAAASSADAEAVVFAGNDVVFGKKGGIDSLSATERFGDIKSDDLSRWILDEVKDQTSWMLEYSRRLERVYCVPLPGGKVYVLHKGLLDARNRATLGSSLIRNEVSPWSKWVTAATFNFEPTMMMRLINPLDGQESVYMGDVRGSMWRLDADIADDDGDIGGSVSVVTCERTSPPIRVEPAQVYNVNGWVKAEKKFSGNLSLTALWGGKQVYDSSTITVALDASSNAPVWGGSGGTAAYWGGTSYWNGSFSGRLHRKNFTLPGQSDELQIKLSTTIPDFRIEEIGIQIQAEHSKQSKTA